MPNFVLFRSQHGPRHRSDRHPGHANDDDDDAASLQSGFLQRLQVLLVHVSVFLGKTRFLLRRTQQLCPEYRNLWRMNESEKGVTQKKIVELTSPAARQKMRLEKSSLWTYEQTDELTKFRKKMPKQ